MQRARRCSAPFACNLCGKPLYRKCGERWLKKNIEDLRRLFGSDSTAFERECNEVRKLYEHYKGRYGVGGNNRFCTTLCAIAWANKRALPMSRGGTSRTPFHDAYEAINLFLEYRDKHGKDELEAKTAAALEMEEFYRC